MAFGIILTAIFSALKFANSLVTGYVSDMTMQPIKESFDKSAFFKFYSHSRVAQYSVPLTYMSGIIESILKDTMTDRVYLHKDEFVVHLQKMAKFESYRYGVCVNGINTVSYSKLTGLLYMRLDTFTPYIHKNPKINKAVRHESLSIKLAFDLCKDFYIANTIRANILGATSSEEIRWMDKKSLNINHITHAISIAIAPVILGIVEIPPSFAKQVQIIVHSDKNSTTDMKDAIDTIIKEPEPPSSLKDVDEDNPDPGWDDDDEDEDDIIIPYEENSLTTPKKIRKLHKRPKISKSVLRRVGRYARVKSTER